MSLAMIGSSICLADQLQWNASAICEEAARAIGRQSLLISYCSQAGADPVELWFVRAARVVQTPTEGLFEVLVLGRRLYTSQRALSSGEFPLSNSPWSFNEVQSPSWFVQGVDLAYSYIPTGDGVFRCLGKVLGLECLVRVETITLPDDVMKSLRVKRSLLFPLPLRSGPGLSQEPQRPSR